MKTLFPPHYLFFDDSVYDNEDFDLARYVMSPPPRTKQSRKALWTALRSYNLQLVSADHCPFCMKEVHLERVKQRPYGRDDLSKIPNGVPVVETRMARCMTGACAPAISR